MMRFVALLLSCCLVAAPVHAEALAYPNTERLPVTDTFHGTAVTEDYRWLEDGADPAVKTWSQAQLQLTRSVLDAVPLRAELKARFKQLRESSPVRYYGLEWRGGLFAMKRQPPLNQPRLVWMRSPTDVASERVVVDPNVLNPKGTTAIDFFVPSIDGRLVAVSLSDNGSEDGSVHVFETQTGRALTDVVPRVQYPTGGGSVAWDPDGKGFLYTRYPQGNERAKEDANFFQQVWHHRLGTPSAQDRYAIGHDFPRIAETMLSASRDGRWVLASVNNGDGGEVAFWLKNPAGAWRRIADHADQVRSMAFGPDGLLYAVSRQGAPRGKVVTLPLRRPDLARARLLVPQSDVTIEGLTPARTRLYVEAMAGGPSQLRVYDLAGHALPEIPTAPVSSATIGVKLDGDEVLVGSESFVAPFAWSRFVPAAGEPGGGRLVATALGGKANFDLDDAVAVREMAKSKDGTLVPVNIVMRKGTVLDGSNPLLLTGYGGYGINLTPRFSPTTRVWLDHGGVFVVANLRGGGEFGEAWHVAGNLTRKQNVFDDFIGSAEHLIGRGYTRPDRLAIIGGSNGGLLMGAVTTQRPDLMRAVVSAVGIYDMLRVELSPNGAFNVTEFGSVADPAQFAALYAYSPYHRVIDGTKYPAVLLTTGENDGRVDPYQSRKMAARLQAANPAGNPVLLRTSASTGHGMGTGLGEQIELDADVYTFLMQQLGMQ